MTLSETSVVDAARRMGVRRGLAPRAGAGGSAPLRRAKFGEVAHDGEEKFTHDSLRWGMKTTAERPSITDAAPSDGWIDPFSAAWGSRPG